MTSAKEKQQALSNLLAEARSSNPQITEDAWGRLHKSDQNTLLAWAATPATFGPDEETVTSNLADLPPSFVELWLEASPTRVTWLLGDVRRLAEGGHLGMATNQLLSGHARDLTGKRFLTHYQQYRDAFEKLITLEEAEHHKLFPKTILAKERAREIARLQNLAKKMAENYLRAQLAEKVAACSR